MADEVDAALERCRFRFVGNRLHAEQPDAAEVEAMIAKASKVTDLVKVWRMVVRGYVRPLTAADRGMMRHLATACGGYDAAAYVVAWAARNWSQLTAGKASAPKAPTIRWLLYHAEEAVRLSTVEPSGGPDVEQGGTPTTWGGVER